MLSRTVFVTSFILLAVGWADSLSLSGFNSQTYHFEGEPGGIFNLVSDIDFHVNARLEAPLVPSIPPRITELGFRVANDQILISVDPETGHLSIRLHDDEIHDTLTIKLAGGSMRRHGEKLVIRLDRYYVKVSKRAEGTLSVEIKYLPNPFSMPHGILGQSAWSEKAVSSDSGQHMQLEGSPSDYQISDDDIFSIRSRFSNFSVTDLWNQEFKMFRDRRSISEANGWKDASLH